jgi:dTDP-glucose 4,6-dehydratase
MMKLVITGGSGFIGSNLINFLNKKKFKLLNIDKLSYASTPEKFKNLKNKKNYKFSRLDICNLRLFKKKLLDFKPQMIINLAANSHVDRSIMDPKNFFNENILITQNILEFLRKNKKIKLIHISTDEVYGSTTKKKFNENSPLNPSSPYSSSKASADLLVNAYSKTYGLNCCILRPSNNFGPYQFTEKFIPTIISKIFKNLPIPVYGKGFNVREWTYVEDTCRAIEKIIFNFQKDHIYNVGSGFCIKNKLIVKKILTNFPKTNSKIRYVRDRAGHDFRYALNSNKIKKSIGWKPKVTLIDGLNRTIRWYLINSEWINHTKKKYQGKRLG